MSVVERQEAIRAMRGRMRSPGRPSKARREDRVRFWEGIAGGVSSEDAAAGAGVSPAVGSRWFRQAGGMPPISLRWYLEVPKLVAMWHDIILPSHVRYVWEPWLREKRFLP